MSEFYGPELNDGSHVLVFGSNLQGIHRAGAALTALRHWGAVQGDGLGRTGMAYAIPTKLTPWNTMALDDIGMFVAVFIRYASEYPELTFLVTAIGCGLAGYTAKQIAPFFASAPGNCVLPKEFKERLKE